MEVLVAYTLAVAMGAFTAKLLDSSDNCNGFFCWKIFCKTEQSSTHVAPNSGSVKLSHELSDLLC